MASQITRIDRELAKNNPEAAFPSPEAVVDEIGLTRAEKLTALTHWSEIVGQRLAAGNEGMPTRGREAADAELAQHIELAKMRLEGRHPID
ncbi:MAG: hypothetical protein AB1749_04895 [Pseudomonadota bacterium]